MLNITDPYLTIHLSRLMVTSKEEEDIMEVMEVLPETKCLRKKHPLTVLSRRWKDFVFTLFKNKDDNIHK